MSKKSDKKEKKKKKQLEQIQAESIKFDVVRLLKNNQFDTKPNVAKFLNEYVKSITATINNGKIQFYPTKIQVSTKIFVKFLDGHEFIYYINDSLPLSQRIYLYYNTDEIEIKTNEITYIEAFFIALIQFKFVY